ncbi:MAG TPA: hypothetical protein VMZ91_05080 [Candidatus Paceibacterota bacterium]|nr:hypothetical protein [Candidatus Paceibacterota bacterium]
MGNKYSEWEFNGASDSISFIDDFDYTGSDDFAISYSWFFEVNPDYGVFQNMYNRFLRKE